VIIEGQQDRWNEEISKVDVGADAGALEVRRLVDRLIAEETENRKLKAV